MVTVGFILIILLVGIFCTTSIVQLKQWTNIISIQNDKLTDLTNKIIQLSESSMRHLSCKNADEKVAVDARAQELQMKLGLLEDTITQERKFMEENIENPVEQTIIVKTADGKELNIAKDWEIL